MMSDGFFMGSLFYGGFMLIASMVSLLGLFVAGVGLGFISVYLWRRLVKVE